MIPKPDPQRPQPSRTFRNVVRFLRPIVMLMTKREWRGEENIPESGFIAVANHISDADPLAFVHFLVDNGVYPTILGKRELFEVPVVGRALRACGVIPVDRGTVGARVALEAATQALAAGGCVVIYPEGTHTYDPDLWPMTAKTGAARLAVRSGAPVVPVVQWGAQRFRHPHTGKFRPWRFTSQVSAGPPVPLAEFGSDPDDYDAVRGASEKITAHLHQQLSELRGEPAPKIPYDRRLGPPDTPFQRKLQKKREERKARTASF